MKGEILELTNPIPYRAELLIEYKGKRIQFGRGLTTVDELIESLSRLADIGEREILREVSFEEAAHDL